MSTRSRYGLRAIVNLALKSGSASVATIAQEEHLSPEYLEKIFSKLKKASLVDVKRGSKGGYFLTKNLTDINLAQIIQALDGKFVPVACIDSEHQFNCSHSSRCLVKKIWAQVQNSFISSLESINLSSLIKNHD